MPGTSTARRAVNLRLMACLVVLCAAVFPSAASAAGTSSSPVPALPGSTSPFAPGVPITPATTPTATTPIVVNTGTTGSSSSGGLSGSDAILIAVGAVVLLGGIAYFIWYDSRRRAPARHGGGRGADADAARSRGSKRPVKPRKLSPAERRRRKRGRAR